MTATLEHHNPSDLLIETNVRADLHLDKAFCASIREHGVLQPVVAVRTDQGLRVRMGQRRTAAACQEGLPSIPVMVIDEQGGDTDRIIEQLTENVHRAALTDADTVTAVEQLALLGCSPTSIAKRTKLGRQRVAQALVVAESDTSLGLVKDGLDLQQAAWLAEFEDEPELHQRLAERIKGRPHDARHLIERARDDRREREAIAVLHSTMAAEHPNATRFAGDAYRSPAQPLEYLSDKATGAGRRPIDPAAHTNCPGHAYQLRRSYAASRDKDLEHDGIGFDILWLCTDWKANGHRERYGGHDSGSADVDDEQRKEQRRLTIALNKAGDAAKTVRLEWLTEFTINGRSGKHLPADWAEFMLATLECAYLAADDKARGLPKALELLGDTTAEGVTGAAACHLLLCARLWSHELHATREIWRQPTLRTYIDYLGAWGYPLSDVEKAGAGHITDQQAYTSLTADGAT